MVVPVKIGRNAVLLEQRINVADQFRLAAMFATAGKNGGMSDNDFPGCFRVRERLIEPRNLRDSILRYDFIPHPCFGSVLLYEWARINEEEFYVLRLRNRFDGGEITRGHLPIRMRLGLIQLCSRSAFVILVA